MHTLRTYPKVSFIIPTLNAQRFLPRCLKAIHEQDYPQDKIEIIISDGGSKDMTIQIARKFGAKIILNPEVLHEPGKSRASKTASGEIFFYIDSDNILSAKKWLKSMVKPYQDNNNIMAFLPQTIPASDSNGLDRYLGFLCTDPFTWFIYNGITSGRDFPKIYSPIKTEKEYTLYQFPTKNPPLFGFSQGTGANKRFKRGKIGYSDDLLAGIKLINEKGLVAYIPVAGVYHYHIDGIRNFIKKYSWRVKNNLSQKIKGMGLVNRKKYFKKDRNLRMYLFVPYSFSIIFPLIDTFKLWYKFKDKVIWWHIPACFLLASIICYQEITHIFSVKQHLGVYE